MNNPKSVSEQIEGTPNCKFGVLNSTETFYNMVSELKQTKRKLLTNCYIEESKLAETISRKAATYEYHENKYLNLVIEDEGFSRLYFYITDIDVWEFQGTKNICVCDIFLRKQEQLLDTFASSIYQKGFVSYAAFHKWICKEPSKVSTPNSDIAFVKRRTDEAIKTLFQCFDKYTDLLPNQDEIQHFLKEKRFICAYDAIRNEFLGAMIYTEKERIITEDFIFVRKEKRGMKISNLLHEYLYNMYSHKKLQYIAWLRDDNIPSITLHQNYNYKKEEIKKITLKRG